MNKRIDDAFALMNDMLTAKPSLESKQSRSSPSRNAEARIPPGADSHKLKSSKSVFPPKPSSSPAHSVLVKDGGRGKKGQNRGLSEGYKSRKKETSLTGTYVKTSNQSHSGIHNLQYKCHFMPNVSIMCMNLMSGLAQKSISFLMLFAY